MDIYTQPGHPGGPVEQKVVPGDQEAGSVDEPPQPYSAQYQYDKKNLLVMARFFRKGNPDGYTIYQYQDNRLARMRTFNVANRLVEDMIFAYDTRGRMTEYYATDSHGKIVTRWKFRYRGRNLIGGSRIQNGDIQEKFVIPYPQVDPKKRVQQLFDGENHYLGAIETYLDGEKIIKRIRRLKYSISENHLRYDSRNRLIEMSFFELSGGERRLLKKHIFVYEKTSKTGVNPE